MALVEAKHIKLGYEDKLLTEDLCFSVNEGDYLFVVGENGSGKTTLMKTLLGLIKPIDGTISFGDGLSVSEIGYLPQQTVVQRDFPATVKEIVLSGCQNHMGRRLFYGRKEKEAAQRQMNHMGIENLANESYRNLSGGQQQRVLLARALCATKSLLVLDEPTAGLDPETTLAFYDLLMKLNREEHITIIMVSHDTEAALKYATHILHIGHEIYFGSRDMYFVNDGCPEEDTCVCGLHWHSDEHGHAHDHIHAHDHEHNCECDHKHTNEKDGVKHE